MKNENYAWDLTFGLPCTANRAWPFICQQREFIFAPSPMLKAVMKLELSIDSNADRLRGHDITLHTNTSTITFSRCLMQDALHRHAMWHWMEYTKRNLNTSYKSILEQQLLEDLCITNGPLLLFLDAHRGQLTTGQCATRMRSNELMCCEIRLLPIKKCSRTVNHVI